VSKLALDPVNHPALSSAPTTPTLRAGDVYYDTTQNALFVYSGSAWIQLGSTTVTSIDAGRFDSIAPYDGGDPTTTASQTYDGGTP
jgi:hypothetical protein